MHVGLQLMHLNGLKESLPLSSDFLIFDRDHLIKIDRAALLILLERTLLVGKPAAAASERFHMISGAQLEVQGFQLILDLRVIGAWAWIQFFVFGNMVRYVTFHR